MSEEQTKVVDTVSTGDHVIVVDEYGRRHHGLVMNAWGRTNNGCINVTFISKNVRKTDTYGRQKQHLSSCSHASQQQAPGRYWYIDPSFARDTEKDALELEAYGQRLEKEEREEKAALRQQFEELRVKDGWDAFTAAYTPKSEALNAEWKQKWEGYNSHCKDS